MGACAGRSPGQSSSRSIAQRGDLAWCWNIPVFAVAIVLVGAIQHRLAGLGHEASHYSFMKNRLLNDLVPDLFCMFPLMTTVHFYRLFHMAHHQFTNDPRSRSRPAEPRTRQAGRGIPDDARSVHPRDLLRAVRRTDPVPAVSVGLFPGQYARAKGRTSTWTVRPETQARARDLCRAWGRSWGSATCSGSTRDVDS